MTKLFVTSILLALSHLLCAQYSFKAIVKSEKDQSPLTGATASVKGLGQSAVADSNGLIIIKNISAGNHTLVFSYVGYEKASIEISFPQLVDTLLTVQLTDIDDAEQEVIVSSTRTSRSIANTPTRIETIDGEELDEKNNMRPANVSMLLHESTGLQVQQTSAVSGNASIRMQGLDGRYTQLLKDGYPNFANFSSGLSILEIPPLDLKQVEVIKGPASTLYGAGAIAGVVNFISKTPSLIPQYNFILNQSNVGQFNAGAYASRRKGKFGFTITGLFNSQRAYDVDHDDFSELSKSNSFTINPVLYFYPDSSITLLIGNSFTNGDNIGGDMHVIQDKSINTHDYFEKNSTTRNVTTAEFDKRLHNNDQFKIRTSLSFFDRKISIPDFLFWGTSTNSYSDFAYVTKKEKHTLIVGFNFLLDQFKQKGVIAAGALNNQAFTNGIYAQDTWDVSQSIKFESGIRIDHFAYRSEQFDKSQLFVLPRFSALFRISNKIASRISGGLGYKPATIFTEQTETIQYQNILPLNNVNAEKSVGGTMDVNYKTNFGINNQFSINQMFFLTRISRPLILQPDQFGNYFFVNANQPILTKGFETNVKFIFHSGVKFFLGYTYTDAKAKYLTGNQFLPLLPKSKLNMALVFEKEKNFKIGLEGYFTGNQYLYNGFKTPSFWELGLMGEKTFNKLTLFLNFENFTDERQSNYKRVINPPNSRPVFDDIWNHVEGFVINGGIKIKL